MPSLAPVPVDLRSSSFSLGKAGTSSALLSLVRRFLVKFDDGILELVSHHHLQFVLSQILPFLAVRADMELGKRVTGYLPVQMCPHHHAFQPHAHHPDGCVVQSFLCTEIGGKVLDEGTEQCRILSTQALIGVLCKQSVASAERRTISAVTNASRSDRCW